MSILRRTEERRADFMAALARDPDNGLEVLLELYWWWGSDTRIFSLKNPARSTWKPKRNASRAWCRQRCATMSAYCQGFPRHKGVS